MSHLAFPLLPQNESAQQDLIIWETAWLLGTDEQFKTSVVIRKHYLEYVKAHLKQVAQR